VEDATGQIMPCRARVPNSRATIAWHVVVAGFGGFRAKHHANHIENARWDCAKHVGDCHELAWLAGAGLTSRTAYLIRGGHPSTPAIRLPCHHRTVPCWAQCCTQHVRARLHIDHCYQIT
jgi:hypothetical protein